MPYDDYDDAPDGDISPEERSSLCGDLLKYAERGSPYQFEVAVLKCQTFAEQHIVRRALDKLLERPNTDNIWLKFLALFEHSPFLSSENYDKATLNKVLWREAFRGETPAVTYLH